MFSLEFQRLRAHLPMQGTWVQSLVQGDPTCPKATKPHVQTTEPTQPRACVSQQEEPLQWEAWALQLESGPCSPPSLEKALSQQWRPSTANELKKKVKQNRKYQGAPQVLWETFHAVCVCVCVCVCTCACIGSSWATPSLLWITVKWLWSHSSTRCRVGCIYLVLTLCPEVLLLPQREANERPRRVSHCRAGTWPQWEPRAPGPALGRFTTTHSHTHEAQHCFITDPHPTHEGAQANKSPPLVSSPDHPHQSLNLLPVLPMTCSTGGFLGVGILSLANYPISNYLSGSQMLDGKVTCTRKAGISVSILTILITLILLSATCLQPFPHSVVNQLYFNTKFF